MTKRHNVSVGAGSRKAALLRPLPAPLTLAIRALIRSAQQRSLTNIIQPNGSINVGVAGSAVAGINFKALNGNTNSTLGFWDTNSAFGANSLDTGTGGHGGVSLWDSATGNNYGEYFSVAGRIYHGMSSGTHPDWYSYTDSGTPFFHLGVGGNGLIGIGTGNNALSYPLEMDVNGSGGTGYNQILIKATGGTGFGANIQWDSTAIGGHKWTTFSGGTSDSPVGGYGFYDNTAGGLCFAILGGAVGVNFSGTMTGGTYVGTGLTIIGNSTLADTTTASNLTAFTITLTNAPTFGLTNTAPANTTTPRAWFVWTNSGLVFKTPGYQ